MMTKCTPFTVQLILFCSHCIWIFSGTPTTTLSPDDYDEVTEIFEQSSFDNLSSLVVDTCGSQLIQRSRRGGRVVGGENSYPGEFPWTVSIRLPHKHHCGGTIIHPEWILTAAHCVSAYGKDNYRVRLGSILKDDFESDRSTILRVREVVIHEHYAAPRRYSHDIALLRLQTRLNFTDYISPVCLPPAEPNEQDTEKYKATKATVVGWGWTSFKQKPVITGFHPQVLQKVELGVIPNIECMGWFKSRGITLALDEKQFCAGYKDGGKDSCSGDSGGPLVVKNPITQKFYIIGIVSAGVSCAEPRLPGVYTRVTSYLDWIKQVTSKE